MNIMRRLIPVMVVAALGAASVAFAQFNKEMSPQAVAQEVAKELSEGKTPRDVALTAMREGVEPAVAASTVIAAAPASADVVATAVIQAAPQSALAVAIAVTAINPDYAAMMVQIATRADPSQAALIASSVASEVQVATRLAALPASAAGPLALQSASTPTPTTATGAGAGAGGGATAFASTR